MNSSKITILADNIFVSVSALSIFYVSCLGIISPQSVMDLVKVSLPNNDAVSSIRGIYGGVGITIVLNVIYLQKSNRKAAMLFLMCFWGAYMFSRLITIFVNGQLGSFGNQWLIIESSFFLISALIFIGLKRNQIK